MTLFVLVGGAAQARAATDAAPTTTPALEALTRGREALDAMDFETASSSLGEAATQLRSLDLREHRDALFSALGLLAAAHLFSDDEPEAKNTLRALLTFDPGWDYPVARRTPELAALLETIRAEVNALSRTPLAITTAPAGATVILDGQTLGKTPLTTGGLLPGRHVIAVASPGFLTRQDEVFVGPDAALSWILEKDPAYVAPVPRDARTFLSRHRAALAFGGATLGAGLTTLFGLRARAATRSARRTVQIDAEAYATLASSAERSSVLANVFFYSAVAGALLGGTFVLLDRDNSKPTTASVVLTPEGAAVIVGGRF